MDIHTVHANLAFANGTFSMYTALPCLFNTVKYCDTVDQLLAANFDLRFDLIVHLILALLSTDTVSRAFYCILNDTLIY